MRSLNIPKYTLHLFLKFFTCDELIEINKLSTRHRKEILSLETFKVYIDLVKNFQNSNSSLNDFHKFHLDNIKISISHLSEIEQNLILSNILVFVFKNNISNQFNISEISEQQKDVWNNILRYANHKQLNTLRIDSDWTIKSSTNIKILLANLKSNNYPEISKLIFKNIQTLPEALFLEEFYHNSTVKELTLLGRIEEKDWTYIRDYISKTTCLRNLIIDCDIEIQPLMEAILENTSLTELTILNQNIVLNDIDLFLKHISKIRRLDMEKIKLDSNHVELFLNKMESDELKLESLSFAGFLSINCYQLLSSFLLRKKSQKLKHLKICVGEGNLEQFYNCLGNNVSLSNLELSGEPTSNLPFLDIIKSFIPNNTITDLKLSGLNILLQEETIKLFLENNRSLITLNLSHNCINRYSLLVLFRNLILNSSIENLVLDGNTITSNEIEFIKQYLEGNYNLKYLSLSDNLILDKGLILLSEGLVKNTVLENLDISMNSILFEGVTKLINALKINKKIKYINLSGNSLNESSFKKVREFKKISNCSIKLRKKLFLKK
jgi:hypothetical protein